MKRTVQHKWMREFETKLHEIPEHKGARVDWIQADILYQKGLSPEDAARRYKVHSANFLNLLLTVGAVV